MQKSVKREVSEKYIDRYFKKKYLISTTRQPQFWNAVILLCENINLDVSYLIDNRQDFCYNNGNYNYHFSSINTKEAKRAKSVTHLAKLIAEQIIEAESMQVSSMELFILQQRVEDMEASIRRIQSHSSNNGKKYYY